MLRLQPRAVYPIRKRALQTNTASPRALRDIRPTIHNSSLPHPHTMTHRGLSSNNNTPPPPPDPDPELTPLPLPTHTTHIKRSYPKSKPTKLLTGLTALLTRPSTKWQLSTSHDAIHLAITLPPTSSPTTLISSITDAAETLSHHPHISTQKLDERCWVCVVTCTTHVPHGLSLKDVRLAEAVDAVVERVGGEGVGVEDGAVAEVVEGLVRRNEERAARARADPGSACAKSV